MQELKERLEAINKQPLSQHCKGVVRTADIHINLLENATDDDLTLYEAETIYKLEKLLNFLEFEIKRMKFLQRQKGE